MTHEIETRVRERSSDGNASPFPKTTGTGSHLDPAPSLMDFPSRTADKIRFADLDRQGHVNNAVFPTLLETGRVELLYDPVAPISPPGSAFVLVRSAVDFRNEIIWPGSVSIGTRVTSVGRSSVKMKQALFQDSRCVATADIVLVLMDDKTRRSRPLSSFAVNRLSELMSAAPAAT